MLCYSNDINSLYSKWYCYKPAYPNVSLNFLAEPNNDSPLNTHASSLWQNKTAYQKLLLEKYNKEAQDGSKSST